MQVCAGKTGVGQTSVKVCGGTTGVGAIGEMSRCMAGVERCAGGV